MNNQLFSGNDVRFSQDYYKGYIENGIPTLDYLSIQDFGVPGDVIPTLSGGNAIDWHYLTIIYLKQ